MAGGNLHQGALPPSALARGDLKMIQEATHHMHDIII